jgi:hypothetical protein
MSLHGYVHNFTVRQGVNLLDQATFGWSVIARRLGIRHASVCRVSDAMAA